MLLHDAIVDVIREHGGPLHPFEISRRIAVRGTYIRGDGAAPPADQIRARVRKYPHLLYAKAGLIYVQGIAMVVPAAPEAPSSQSIVPILDRARYPDLSAFSFRAVAGFDELAPRVAGLYAIRLADPSALPEELAAILRKRGNRLLYIGQASTTIAERLAQELRARGHGTFFRSLGAILGYLPPPASLRGLSNQTNYRFTRPDEQAIIAWLDRHAEVGWLYPVLDLAAAEQALIAGLGPLLNIQKTPAAVTEVIAAREKCRTVARGDQGP